MLRNYRFYLGIILFLATTIGCKSAGEDKQVPIAGDSGAITVTVDGPWSASVKWSAATDNESRSTALEYQVLVSKESNIGSVADAQANGQIVKDWTADTTQAALIGLDDGETYYVTVIAKDELGNVVNYQVASFTTEDATGPTAGEGGTITISDVDNSSANVTWSAATDAVSGGEKLLYRVVYSTVAGVGSVGSAPSVALDWTANATSAKLTGLKDGTNYYVQVLVKDEAGLISTYEPATFSTLDGTSPVPGNGGQLTVSELALTGAKLTWVTAVDGLAEAHLLTYKVYYSTESNISTPEDAENNGSVATDWTANLQSATLSGLTPDTTYYTTVVVKDSDGNLAQYAVVELKTRSVDSDTTPPVAGNGGQLTLSNITQTGAMVSWVQAVDSRVAAHLLEYKVITSKSDNIGNATDAQTNGTVVMDWTANLSSAQLSGLDPATDYWVMTLVRDTESNITSYSVAKFTTGQPDDVTGPVPGGGTYTISTSGTGFKVSWLPATDDSSPADELEYRVYVGTVPLDEKNYQSDGTAVGDWSKDASISVDGLDDAMTYHFVIVVRDNQGNISVYPAGSATTPDVTIPAVANLLAPSVSGISDTTATVSWFPATDNASDTDKLEYKLVISTSQDIGSIASANIDASAGNKILALDWTANTTSNGLTGLSQDTMYYLALLVRDETGNIAMYPLSLFTTNKTPLPDTMGPTVDGIMLPVVTNITTTTATVAWVRAKDDVTPSDQLQYKVVISFSDNIGSVDDADITQSGDGKMLVQDWTNDINSLALSNLAPGVSYYVTVLVRDAAGNTENYVSVLFTTQQNPLAPAPGANGGLVASPGNGWFRLDWARATDATTSQSSLRYMVVYSDSPDIGDPTMALANGTPVNQSWLQNINTINVNNLVWGATYWVNVLVRNNAGLISSYGMIQVKILNEVLIFATYPRAPGKIGAYMAQTDPRLTLNGKCAADRSGDPRFGDSGALRNRQCEAIVAFLGINAEDSLANLGHNFKFPMTAELWGPKGRISPTITDFLDGSKTAELTLEQAGVPLEANKGYYWWSLSKDKGLLHVNCVNDPGGAVGSMTDTDGKRVHFASYSCQGESSFHWLICLCF